MTDLEKAELRSLIFKAWEMTTPCPDGSPFCPACFFETFYKLLEQRNNNV
jgi:hypothetical protein